MRHPQGSAPVGTTAGGMYRPAVVLGVLSALFAAGVADLAYGIVVGYRVRVFDFAVALWVGANRVGWLTAIMGAWTHIGDEFVASVIVAALCAWLWWGARRHAYAIFLLSVTLSAALVNAGLKVLIDRTRPAVMLAVIPTPHTASFPSGHTVLGMTLFGSLAIFAILEWGLKRAWPAEVLLMAACALLGISRVYLGVHWLSDVLAGWLLGLSWLCGASAIWFVRIVRKGPRPT